MANKKETIKRSEVQSKLIVLLEILEKRCNHAEADIKDITLFYKMLNDLGAIDDIIAKETKEVVDIADRNFSMVFTKDLQTEKKRLGL